MFLKNWKKEFLTIPNLLSLCRILLIPLYVPLYLKATGRQQILAAGSLMILSCITDVADGKIARQCGQITNVGKLLDPLADKLTQLSMILCLGKKYTVLYLLLILFLIKELTQLYLFLSYYRKGLSLDGALPAGKVSTAVLFISLIIMVLFPELHKTTAEILISCDFAFLAFSFFSYLQAYRSKGANLRNLPGDS